jgi:hypothetical protein
MRDGNEIILTLHASKPKRDGPLKNRRSQENFYPGTNSPDGEARKSAGRPIRMVDKEALSWSIIKNGDKIPMNRKLASPKMRREISITENEKRNLLLHRK